MQVGNRREENKLAAVVGQLATQAYVPESSENKNICQQQHLPLPEATAARCTSIEDVRSELCYDSNYLEGLQRLQPRTERV